MPPLAGRPRRSFLALAAAAGLAAISAGVAFREHTRYELTVVDRSGRTITSLQAALPGETLRFGPIPAGQTVSRSFRIESDAHFAIAGELADDTRLRADEVTSPTTSTEKGCGSRSGPAAHSASARGAGDGDGRVLAVSSGNGCGCDQNSRNRFRPPPLGAGTSWPSPEPGSRRSRLGLQAGLPWGLLSSSVSP